MLLGTHPPRRVVEVLVSAVAIFAPTALVRAASFQGLGDLPGGATEGYAIGVSADGQAVAGHSRSASGDEAFVWTAGAGMVGLGDLPAGAFDSFSTMASNGGSIVVGYGSVLSGYRPFRWTSGGGMTNLGDLPGGGGNGFATGMSADGSVVSGQSTSASGTEAFRWTTGGMVGLGDLPGGAFNSSAWAVSADGTALVGDGTTAAGTEAFLWTAAGGMVPLGYLPGGGTFSGAHGASAGGGYVVGASDSSYATPGYLEAFRWSEAGGMAGLGDLPGGPIGSFANGVSADGRVVVGGSETASGTEAYFWTPECGMVHLKTYLLSRGIDAVSSWLLQNAHGVSADGATIVGYGINPSGQTEPWIARVDSCTGAGSVPDGSEQSPPLLLAKGPGNSISLSWSPSCHASDVDYEVYEGGIGIFDGHAPRLCSTSGATTALLVPALDDAYYLVVASDGGVEGSYGRDGEGAERPASLAACLVQAIGSCP